MAFQLIKSLLVKATNLPETKVLNKCEIHDEDICSEIGVVTRVVNNSLEINSLFLGSCDPDDFHSFEIGNLVSFSLPPNNESNVVTNLKLVKVDALNLTNKNLADQEGIVSYLDREHILINPNSVFLRLDSIELTYIPHRGDHVSLKKNENKWRLIPKNCRVTVGKLLKWDDTRGILEGQILIRSDVCESYYWPTVGDKNLEPFQLICSSIQCDGEDFKWRALIAQKYIQNVEFREKRKMIDNIPVGVVEAGKEAVLEVPIKNTSLKQLHLEEIIVNPPMEDVQINLNCPLIIYPGCSCSCQMKLKGRIPGTTKDFDIIFKFRNFQFKKKVKYYITDQDSCKTDITTRKKLLFIQGGGSRDRFWTKIKSFNIPGQLTEILRSREGLYQKMFCLQEKFPDLKSGLCQKNYNSYLHLLLFFEEFEKNAMMEQLELVTALRRKGQYYALTLDEGSFRSLCAGDLAFFSNPSEKTQGVPIKIWMKTHNELIFNFKDVNNIVGEQGVVLRVRFQSSRGSQVRIHHAINLFHEHIGSEWLFPLAKHKSAKPCNLERSKLRFFKKTLNQSQQHAVISIVKGNNLDAPFLLHGPPGTGKTFTIVECVLRILVVDKNCRILVTAPSNSAVNTFCEMLLGTGLISHNDLLRLLSYNYSLGGQLPESLKKSAAVVGTDNGLYRNIDLNDLGREKITAATLTTISFLNQSSLHRGYYTHIFIDEAGQTTEPETLIPLAGMAPGKTRVVLAGDPKQLGPVIISRLAKKFGLGYSLMDRLLQLPFYARQSFGETSFIDQNVVMLRINYRSVPGLVKTVGKLFYRDQLESGIHEENGIFNDIQEKLLNSNLYHGDTFFVPSNGTETEYQGECFSYKNLNESGIVTALTLKLFKQGLEPHHIGVITPYTLQVATIKNCFQRFNMALPKIGTVEEFQGDERPIMIISLVRTVVDNCLLSFINEPQRANVALSRAKLKNIIIGNLETIKHSDIWRFVVERATKILVK